MAEWMGREHEGGEHEGGALCYLDDDKTISLRSREPPQLLSWRSAAQYEAGVDDARKPPYNSYYVIAAGLREPAFKEHIELQRFLPQPTTLVPVKRKSAAPEPEVQPQSSSPSLTQTLPLTRAHRHPALSRWTRMSNLLRSSWKWTPTASCRFAAAQGSSRCVRLLPFPLLPVCCVKRCG